MATAYEPTAADLAEMSAAFDAIDRQHDATREEWLEAVTNGQIPAPESDHDRALRECREWYAVESARLMATYARYDDTRDDWKYHERREGCGPV